LFSVVSLNIKKIDCCYIYNHQINNLN